MDNLSNLLKRMKIAEQQGRIGKNKKRQIVILVRKTKRSSGPLVRPNGSLDRHGKVEKSGPDRSFIRKKSRIRAISDLTKLKY